VAKRDRNRQQELGSFLDLCDRVGFPIERFQAGVNVKALSTYIGHANIRITLDQYGHLLPGAEDEAAGMLDAFLARQLGGAEVKRGRVRSR
jgi:hypothetical protein